MIQNNTRHYFPRSFLYLIVFTLFLAPVANADTVATEKPETVSSDKEILLESVIAAPLDNELRAMATIQQDPQRSAIISPRINGWISSVNVLPGKNVSKGETLATVDSMQLRDESNALAQARANLNAASEVLKRKQKLMEEEIIPRNELTAATLTYRQAKAEFDTVQARQSLLGAKSSTSSVAITAPFDGTILTSAIRQQQAITPADILFTLSDLSTVMIIANIPESQVRFIKPGAPVRIQASAWPGESFPGQIVSTAGTLDPTSRTLAAHIAVSNQDLRLKPEMYVTAFISYTSSDSVISVADSALTLIEGKPTVFIENTKAEYVPVHVTTGRKGAARTEITGGLKPGDRVVVNQTYDLKSRLLISETAGGH